MLGDVLGDSTASRDSALAILEEGGQVQLSNWALGDANAAGLADGVCRCDGREGLAISALLLAYNELTDVGAVALARVLRVASLTSLGLQANRIGDEGTSAIAASLQPPSGLRMLYLSGNCVGDVGAQALARAITGRHALTRLYLSGNTIGDEVVSAVSPVLSIS